jgi:hypothetical protein
VGILPDACSHGFQEREKDQIIIIVESTPYLPIQISGLEGFES